MTLSNFKVYIKTYIGKEGRQDDKNEKHKLRDNNHVYSNSDNVKG